MNESFVTLQGWVGSEVTRRDANGVPVATFRVGCTPRFRKGEEWVDGPTSWYTVDCWRNLARNVAESIRKGDAVVVRGKVRVDVWQRDPGQPPSERLIVDAVFVGHDLNRGTTVFTKALRPPSFDPFEDAGVKEVVHGYDVAGPRLDSQGREVAPLPEEAEPAA